MTWGVVRAGHPKMKHPSVQHVLVEAEWVIKVFEAIHDRLGTTSELICPWSPSCLAKHWQWLLEELPLQNGVQLTGTQSGGAESKLTPEGLRAGSATSDYLATQNTMRARRRGRWVNEQTLRHYIQMGTYMLTSTSFSEQSRLRIERFRALWQAFVSAIMSK